MDLQKVLGQLIAIRDDLKISLKYLPASIQEAPLVLDLESRPDKKNKIKLIHHSSFIQYCHFQTINKIKLYSLIDDYLQAYNNHNTSSVFPLARSMVEFFALLSLNLIMSLINEIYF